MTHLNGNAYASALLALGIPPRAVMHLVLEDLVATLGDWTHDVMTCDELALVQQARAHLQNAEHCMSMLLRPSEALCEPHYPLHLHDTEAPPAPCVPYDPEARYTRAVEALVSIEKNLPPSESLGGQAGGRLPYFGTDVEAGPSSLTPEPAGRP